ncbi:DegV family protein [Oenococcus sp. UCMA 16435]|nr:DegV family protein [Oenococcus sp. UCMA 16435]
MRKIAIIVDSSSYIPKDQLKKHHIYVIDNPIIFGETIYHESNWPVNADFYQQMAVTPLQPTTSQPAPGDFEAAFKAAKADGYQQALVITLSSGFSGTFVNTSTAASHYPDLDIRVWDSRIACAGTGHQALLAADLAEKGIGLDEILRRLQILRSRTGVFFVVDSINHLQRTGRLSGGQALIAGLLNIKPILNINTNKQGKIDAVAKTRKMSGAWRYIEEHFSKVADDYRRAGWPLRVSIVDANNPKLADAWLKKAKKLWPEIIFERGIIGPLIGVHIGGKAVGLIWGEDYKRLED